MTVLRISNLFRSAALQKLRLRQQMPPAKWLTRWILPPKPSNAKGGLLAGLTKALRREEKPPVGELAGSTLPKTEPTIEAPVILAETGPASDPISGAPDLNAIMKRVRDERRGRTDGKPDDNAKNDFLAAARRAAQAAAADAEILKKQKRQILQVRQRRAF